MRAEIVRATVAELGVAKHHFPHAIRRFRPGGLDGAYELVAQVIRVPAHVEVAHVTRADAAVLDSDAGLRAGRHIGFLDFLNGDLAGFFEIDASKRCGCHHELSLEIGKSILKWRRAWSFKILLKCQSKSF